MWTVNVNPMTCGRLTRGAFAQNLTVEFAHLTNELSRERVLIVLEHDYGSIPDDDPRWNKEGFEPPLVPTSVHLFAH